MSQSMCFVPPFLHPFIHPLLSMHVALSDIHTRERECASRRIKWTNEPANAKSLSSSSFSVDLGRVDIRPRAGRNVPTEQPRRPRIVIVVVIVESIPPSRAVCRKEGGVAVVEARWRCGDEVELLSYYNTSTLYYHRGRK